MAYTYNIYKKKNTFSRDIETSAENILFVTYRKIIQQGDTGPWYHVSLYIGTYNIHLT